MKKLLIVALLSVSASVFAKEVDCEKKAEKAGERGNVGLIRDCVYEQNEKTLKKSLENAVKTHANDKEAVVLLLKNQDDWEKFRQSTCDYLALTSHEYGYPDDERWNCQLSFYEARLKVLKKYTKN